jgi:hypothetical protein
VFRDHLVLATSKVIFLAGGEDGVVLLVLST